jgi:VWFA-related protein
MQWICRGTDLAGSAIVRSVLALLMLSSFVRADDTPPPATFPVEAQIVYVHVAVTDSRGRPVRDLGREDFALYQDGRAVPIVAFRAPSSTRVAPGAVVPGAPPASNPVPLAAPPEPVTFVAYIDNWNLTTQGRKRVLPGLASFLKEQLAFPGTRAVVVTAGPEARVLSRLTHDVEEILTALRAAEREPVRGYVTRSDARQVIETVESIMRSVPEPCEDIVQMLQVPIHVQARARSREMEQTLARLEAVTQALGTLPGSKALLYVSDGLEQRPAIDLFHQLGDICPAALRRDFSTLFAPMQEYDLSRAFQALGARANAARVTLYPIDGSGLQGYSAGDLSQTDRRFIPSPKTDSIRFANLRAGQSILADETGGTTVFSTNDPREAMGQIAEKLRSEYVLGLAPEHGPEGGVHRLRVELLRKKGRHLRYTPSYLHAHRAEAGASRTLAALLVGLEEDTLGAEVSLDPWPAGGDPKVARTAKVRVGLPLARLTAVERADERHGRVRVVIAIWRVGAHAREQPLELREQLIDVPLPPTAAAGGSAPGRREFVVEVPLRADHREIGVGIHDANSRLTTYRRLRVAATESGGP